MTKNPRGGTQDTDFNKGFTKQIFTIFLHLSLHFRVLKLRFVAFPEDPGGFRELRGLVGTISIYPGT